MSEMRKQRLATRYRKHSLRRPALPRDKVTENLVSRNTALPATRVSSFFTAPCPGLGRVPNLTSGAESCPNRRSIFHGISSTFRRPNVNTGEFIFQVLKRGETLTPRETFLRYGRPRFDYNRSRLGPRYTESRRVSFFVHPFLRFSSRNYSFVLVELDERSTRALGWSTIRRDTRHRAIHRR